MSKKFHATLNRLVEQSANNNPRSSRSNPRARFNPEYEGLDFALPGDVMKWRAYQSTSQDVAFEGRVSLKSDPSRVFNTAESAFFALIETPVQPKASAPRQTAPPRSQHLEGRAALTPEQIERLKGQSKSKLSKEDLPRAQREAWQYRISPTWGQYKLLMILAQMPSASGQKQSRLRYGFVSKNPQTGEFEHPFFELDKRIRGQVRDVKKAEIAKFFNAYNSAIKYANVARWEEKMRQIELPESFTWEGKSYSLRAPADQREPWGFLLKETPVERDCSKCRGSGCVYCHQTGKSVTPMNVRPGRDVEIIKTNAFGQKVLKGKKRLPFTEVYYDDFGDAKNLVDRMAMDVAARIALGTFLHETEFPAPNAKLIEGKYKDIPYHIYVNDFDWESDAFVNMTPAEQAEAIVVESVESEDDDALTQAGQAKDTQDAMKTIATETIGPARKNRRS